MVIREQNNLSLGVDIEGIKRFKNLRIFKDGFFLKRIYTKNELTYCFKKINSGSHLAGRFAAKEAVFKALAALGAQGIPLKKIEILASIDGAPQVKIHSLKCSHWRVSVSISHCAEWAIAFAIAMKYDDHKGKNLQK